MRLLHTSRLQFEEFYEEEIPTYAILSHRWDSVDQEVSYAEFKSGEKGSTSGYAKILSFCSLVRTRGFDYCWIDTCCIDKSSSAELSEAINSMFNWYQRAAMCFAYLRDVSKVSKLGQSEWFSRGWTLQELIAPPNVQFFNKDWQPIGTRFEQKRRISEVSGIDEALLSNETELYEYSIAQIMSWASRRQTSRIEDQAYCLLGLFGVNMPLLYGERASAFRRLQEEILANGGDYSVFAWKNTPDAIFSPSILAPSPTAFQMCGKISKGFETRRILFEISNRGMMLLIHRSYDPKTLDQLVEYDVAFDESTGRALGLTIPLGCYQKTTYERMGIDVEVREAFFLQLVCLGDVWYRVGVKQTEYVSSTVPHIEKQFPAYGNDYIRIYIAHDSGRQDRFSSVPIWVMSDWLSHGWLSIEYLYLGDSSNDHFVEDRRSAREVYASAGNMSD